MSSYKQAYAQSSRKRKVGQTQSLYERGNYKEQGKKSMQWRRPAAACDLPLWPIKAEKHRYLGHHQGSVHAPTLLP